MNRVIGVDFDNTIVGYEDVFHDTAVEMGLIGMGAAKGKKNIRDQIRALPEGEMAWRRLQAVVYGTQMNRAKLERGVEDFFRECQQRKIKAYIISHKSKFAAADEGKNNLQTVALDWMRGQRFFDAQGWGMSEADVFFEDARAGKLRRIEQLKCSHFIDDLEETFLEPSFPSNAEKILYDPRGEHSAAHGARVFASWRKIADYLFHDRK